MPAGNGVPLCAARVSRYREVPPSQPLSAVAAGTGWRWRLAAQARTAFAAAAPVLLLRTRRLRGVDAHAVVGDDRTRLRRDLELRLRAMRTRGRPQISCAHHRCSGRCLLAARAAVPHRSQLPSACVHSCKHAVWGVRRCRCRCRSAQRVLTSSAAYLSTAVKGASSGTLKLRPQKQRFWGRRFGVGRQSLPVQGGRRRVSAAAAAGGSTHSHWRVVAWAAWRWRGSQLRLGGCAGCGSGAQWPAHALPLALTRGTAASGPTSA